MRLRARLAATCLAVAGPALLAIGLAQQDAERRTLDAVLRDHVAAWRASGPATCAGPILFGPAPPPPPIARVGPIVPEVVPVPGPHLWLHGYDGAGRPLSPGAPPLDPELEAEAGRAGHAARWVRVGDAWARERLERVAPLPDGCRWVLARRASAPGATLPTLLPWLAASLLSPAVVWVAMGRPVRRLRALAASVRRAARDGYRAPVRVDGDDEVGELARAFDEAAAEIRAHAARIEDRERILRRFVADTTHDLMTPLTVLQGELARLEEEVRGPVAAEALVQASQEAQYLSSLVRDLGTVARLEADPDAPFREPFDLAEVVERVARRHRPLARRKGVALEHGVPADPVPVIGDATLAEQAIGNVVHNAIRHHHRGGNAAVTLDRAGGGFVLRVRDDGPGVAEADLPRLGERRWRADDARTRHPDGQGLGLAITRQVCERHGWTLAFRPAPGGGLEVEIRG